MHGYLKKHIITGTVDTCPTVEEVSGKITCLEDTIIYLQNGYKIVQQANTKSLQASLQYGKWLNMAFELHQMAKAAGYITCTWTEWIEKTIGISKSYSSKLREIATLLSDYHQFQNVGLAFAEIYQKRKDIKSMLIVHTDISTFWKSKKIDIDGLSDRLKSM